MRTARSASPTRSRCHATRFFINTATRLASTRSMRSARCWESAKNPALHLSGEQTGDCPGRSGCKFTIRANAGPRRTRPMFRSVRATTLVSPLQMAMAYATVANGGISLLPAAGRQGVEPGRHARCSTKKANRSFPRRAIRADLRDEVSRAGPSNSLRRGLWKVVNEDGGTGGQSASVRMCVVAGKTGTAQAIDHGREGKRRVVLLFRAVRSIRSMSSP